MLHGAVVPTVSAYFIVAAHSDTYSWLYYPVLNLINL